MTRPRLALWIGVGVAGGVLALAIAAYVMVRPAHLKRTVERKISERLQLDTSIGNLSLGLWPRPMVIGEKIEIRLPNRPDLPPFIAIDRFSVGVGLLSVIRGHVGTVQVDGLKINVPPGDAKKEVTKSSSSGDKGATKIIIDHVVTHDSVLTILRTDPNRKPLVFNIHDLQLNDLGFERVIPFSAKLSNPVPEGEIVSNGTLGPWNGEPANLPLQGDYTFMQANLDTIRGIGGTLKSDGHYTGALATVRVVGKTDTPDFNLDLGGKPVPLSTTFTATVNGSNGSTRLEEVEAHLFNTVFHVNGDIVNLPGPEGFKITLAADIDHGHIEDVLQLVVNGKPFMTGDMTMHSTVEIPAGHEPAKERLRLDGQFVLNRGEFTGDAVERKVADLSRRSQGKDKLEPDEPVDRVLTKLGGRFRLESGVMTLNGLTFQVPGADVSMAGSYALAPGTLDFQGSLRMQTSMSNAVGGIKSIFLKPFDWLFKKDGAGAVIPIKITGTRDKPSFGLRVGAALTRGK